MSFGSTICLFLAYCYAVRIPLRDPITLGNAIIAGVGGPVLIALIKRYLPAFDPDKFYGDQTNQ